MRSARERATFRLSLIHILRLVRATRPVSNGEAPDYIKRWIRWGASPRASQYLILAGRARAACQGRFNVACEDVAALAPLVLRHRLIRTFQADAEGKTTDEIIAQLLQDVAREWMFNLHASKRVQPM